MEVKKVLKCYKDKIEVVSGFTLIELLITVSILGILAAVAVPAFSSWIPEYRLKTAVRDLYSNIRLAKTLAIKHNCKYRLVFSLSGGGSYTLGKTDGPVEKSVDLQEYGPNGEIVFGNGNAIRNATISGGPFPGDFISYPYNKATFNSRCMCPAGYVYLANKRGTAYAVGTWLSGNVVIKKWNEKTGSWEG